MSSNSRALQAILVLAATFGVSTAVACSGPPPPKIAILPSKIEREGLSPIEIADISGDNVNVDFEFCEAPNETNCYDAALSMSRLEVPAGSEVTFQAYYDKNAGSAGRTGPVFGGSPRQFFPIGNLLSDIQASQSNNTNRRMRVSELMSRGSGGAIDPAGGLRPMLVLDWAGIVSSEGVVEQTAGGYRMSLDAGTELDRPSDWSGSWDGTQERWYTRAGQITDPREVIRTVSLHMGSKADVVPEFWVALETSGTTINKLHVWSTTGARMPNANTNNMFIQLDASAGTNQVQSTWAWDIKPSQIGGATSYGDFPHVPVNGNPASGVGYSAIPEYAEGVDPAIQSEFAGTAFEFEAGFRQKHRYDTPSEPGGYVVKVTVSFLWKYGREAGGDPFAWEVDVKHIGSIDFTPMQPALTTDDGAGGAELVAMVDSIRSQLGCLPGPLAAAGGGERDEAGDGCTWGPYDDTTFPIAALQSAALSGSVGQGVRDELVSRVMAAGTYTGDDQVNFTPDTTSTPQRMDFRYSGQFPQTTGAAPPGGGGGNGGQPGYAYVLVRDGTRPRHFRFLDPGDTLASGVGTGPFVSNVSIPANQPPSGQAPVITGLKTGQTIAEALGSNTKMMVAVFDENPGLVAFASVDNADLKVWNGSSLTAPSSNLSEYSSLLQEEGSTPPTIQVWYSAEKSGYEVQPSTDYGLMGGAFFDRVIGDLGVPAPLVASRAMSADNRLVGRPTFRYYPFRYPKDDADEGKVVEYRPVRYILLQERQGTTDEPFGSAMVYEIDLAHALEPMGLHYAQGSQQGGDDDANLGVPIFPGSDDSYQLRLFVRAADGRVASTSRAQDIYPADWAAIGATSTGFQWPNYSPAWLDKGAGDPTQEVPEHVGGAGPNSPSLAMARLPFPDGNNDVPANFHDPSTGILEPPPLSGDNEAAIQAKAAELNFVGTKFGQALGLEVEDSVPPTVLLQVTDTKYDRTYTFGNAYLGDMSQQVIQQLLYDQVDQAAGGELTQATVLADPSLSPDDENTNLQTGGAALFPFTAYPYGGDTGEFNQTVAVLPQNDQPPRPHSLEFCDQATAINTGGCLVEPDTPGGTEWTFTYEGQGGPSDYETQLEEMANGRYWPMQYFAHPAVPDAALAVDRTQPPPGLWVDEDSRLVFKVIVWDNLNSYLPGVTEVGSFTEGLQIFGVDSASLNAGNSPDSLEVVINDPGSGQSDMSLSSGQLDSTWPTYIFRNPNRTDDGNGLSDTGDDAHVEVKYTDAAGNTTRLHVKFFVVENTMRILSLKEDRFRSFNE